MHCRKKNVINYNIHSAEVTAYPSVSFLAWSVLLILLVFCVGCVTFCLSSFCVFFPRVDITLHSEILSQCRASESLILLLNAM